MARVLVTGGAGFIGSHIVDALVERGHEVRVFDNLSNGFRANLEHHQGRIEFLEQDLRDQEAVKRAMQGIDWVSHQAALGSVPRSINDPFTSNDVNVSGTLNVLIAAKDAGVKRLVMASSSSVYGDTEVSPKHEGLPLNPKSPYSVSKVTAESYTRVFHGVYGLETIALRYFNIFGPRQTPFSQYAAVVPLFTYGLLEGKAPRINGDGSFSRDFTFVANAVHANLLALEAPSAACGRAYNVGAGGNVTVLELFRAIQAEVGSNIEPEFGPVRAGDVAHSKASIDAAREAFGYGPIVSFEDGIRQTVASFKSLFAAKAGVA